MYSEELRKMNILTKSLYERYRSIANERTAIIMACVEGKQPEICEFLLKQEKDDQEILMRETYAHLVPRVELYPIEGSAPTSPPSGAIRRRTATSSAIELDSINSKDERDCKAIPFALDDFIECEEVNDDYIVGNEYKK